MATIYGKGHELLALFDIEYEKFSAKITDVLMENPDTRYKLTLTKAPLKKKHAKK